jgi:nitrite reductase/ring-hydroxylating ferredoxin subunit
LFKNPPRVIAHKSAVTDNVFVTKDRLITKDSFSRISVFNRSCPHKFYPIGEEGGAYSTIQCKLHGFEFDQQGKGINNSCKLKHSVNYSVGPSGLIYENFEEPKYWWIFNQIRDEKLTLAETTSGSSTGSWLWNMDMEVDILHVREGGIHPWLATQFKKEDIVLSEGDGFVLQTQHDGFWLLIYPFTFIEWSKGCLGIKTVRPNNINNEYGFTWSTQLYFSEETPLCKKYDFAKLKEVYQEDVIAIEQITEPYRLIHTNNPLEKQNVHFGEWVNRNRL